LTIEQTAEYLKTHWPRIRSELLDGTYRPQAIRRVEIPKPMGGTRELGIPTVIDRLIQQALLQDLQPIIDPMFSEFSYGFRPGRSAHEAVLRPDCRCSSTTCTTPDACIRRSAICLPIGEGTDIALDAQDVCATAPANEREEN